MKTRKKVLFFIAGSIPTEAENAEAEQFHGRGFHCCFRNSRFVRPDEACEDFDLLAGLVPDNYAKVAAAKPVADDKEAPKVPASDVVPGSPLAADKAEGGKGAAGEPSKAPATPKPPKADSSKGWKPNA